MIKYITLVILAACGTDYTPTIADAMVSPDTITSRMPDTWHAAFVDWRHDYCLYAKRCSPDWYNANYDNVIDCSNKLAQNDCDNLDLHHLAINCQSKYPEELYIDDNQCMADMARLKCTQILIPSSCDRAFILPTL